MWIDILSGTNILSVLYIKYKFDTAHHPYPAIGGIVRAHLSTFGDKFEHLGPSKQPEKTPACTSSRPYEHDMSDHGSAKGNAWGPNAQTNADTSKAKGLFDESKTSREGFWE